MSKKILIFTMVFLLIFTSISYVFAEENYYVQVGAFKYKSNADKYSNYLNSVGYDKVKVIKIFNLYKVFLGPFSTEEEARSISSGFMEAGGSSFLVLESRMYDEPVKTEATETATTETETTESETTETTETETTETETTETETTETETTETETTETETTETETTETETTENETTDVDDEEVNQVIDTINDSFDELEETDYKMFTIILIVMLWLLFIMIVVVYRLNQNRKK